jgi:hypothetical protein
MRPARLAIGCEGIVIEQVEAVIDLGEARLI